MLELRGHEVALGIISQELLARPVQ